MTPETEYAEALAAWERARREIALKREGYRQRLHETCGGVNPSHYSMAASAFPYPPKPEKPRVPRVVTIHAGGMAQMFRVVGRRVENAIGYTNPQTARWTPNEWSLADFALVAGLEAHPFEDDAPNASPAREDIHVQP